MKNYTFLLFFISCTITHAQIFTEGANDGAITITPKGLRGKTNSASEASNVAVGNNALLVNTIGYYNVAIGELALSGNLDGYLNTAVGSNTLLNNTSGHHNSAYGAGALKLNTTGIYNTAIGERALENTSEGYFNTSLGSAALYNNTTGVSNTANGTFALYSNKIGSYNTGIGERALFKNISSLNTAVGYYSLYENTSGGSNTGTGYYALNNNTTGAGNTASGYSAGSNNTAGNYNTFIGYQANSSVTVSNSTAIGSGANVDASNKVRIGNSSVTVIEGQVAYTYPSDRRLKENIVYTDRLGLDFISRLKTVSYSYISDKTKVRHDGFIAQDIEQVMKDLGVPFSGLKKTEEGTYSLAYSDFIMPLVNSVKELKQQNQKLEQQNASILKQLDELKAMVLQVQNDKQTSASK
ncbi:tail fiber domain-containing protein [Emticicia fontis]